MTERLMELGFTEYEARAYIALLEANPVTAYEAAKNSGIPTSKIYEVLDRLETKGIVQAFEEGDRRKFVPLEAGQFLDAQSVRLSGTIGDLRAGLESIGNRQSVSLVWNVRDYRSLSDYLKTIIDSAKSSLLVSAWPEEITAIRDGLKAAVARGTKVAIVLFGEPGALGASASAVGHAAATGGAGMTEIGIVYPHPIGYTLYAEKGGRGITAVADGAQAIVATISGGGDVEGAWSRNGGFVALAEDCVKHDIYVMKIVERFDGELIAKFGAGYARLRDVFTDTEEES
jgi:HTH-type transcriptional regulator, sugar sensing transcriptional regulator